MSEENNTKKDVMFKKKLLSIKEELRLFKPNFVNIIAKEVNLSRSTVYAVFDKNRKTFNIQVYYSALEILKKEKAKLKDHEKIIS